MAEGGYDFEFLNPGLASSYECMICQYVVRNSQQAQCCGATYCRRCISSKKRSFVGCPNCRASSFILTQDKAQTQMINELRLKCPYCEWVGDLGSIHTHLGQEHPQVAVTSAASPVHVIGTSGRRRSADADDESASSARELDSSFCRNDNSGSLERLDALETVPLIELNRLDSAGDSPTPALPQPPQIAPSRLAVACCTDAVYASKTTKV